MGVDGLFLHMIKKELAAFAVGSKIDKIYLPTKYELVLGLRSREGAKKLFISVGGNAPRLHFTEHVPENPAKPPMLCMLFRKLLTGAVITDIRQQGLDRVLMFDLNASNEIGDRVQRTLVVEIMAQYSNCILLDADGPFTARVETATYMGQTFQYSLSCDGTAISVADYRYHTNGVYKPGDTVHWTMVEPSLRLIPAEGEKA